MKKHIKKETKRLWPSKDARLKANAPGEGNKKKNGRKRKRKEKEKKENAQTTEGERADYFPRGGNYDKK